jgi:hypothetical protein
MGNERQLELAAYSIEVGAKVSARPPSPLSGQPYVNKGMGNCEASYREQKVRYVAKRAQQLGLQVVKLN